MKNQLLNKRIPTIFGIGIVALAIGLTTFALNFQTNLRSKASNSEEPQNVKITNISQDSFTVTYKTGAAITGSINYGKGKELGNTELDDSDKEKDGLSAKNIHSITVKKLSPETKYQLVIVSGQNTFLNKGVPFEISTGLDIASPSATTTIINGKIILPDGTAPDQAIAYLSSENSQLLSTTTTKGGEFSFALNQLRSEDLSSYFQPDGDAVFRLIIMNNSLKSTVLFSPQETNSIPTVTLSNDYNFIKDKSVAVATKSAEFQSSGFPPSSIKSTDLKPQILTPKKDQSFTDQRPQFYGTSLPNSKVDITIHSQESIQTQIISDSNGNWTYRPPTTLSPGEHTITIQTKDSSGILTTLMQSFTVFAEGTQISESATPSATIAPISTPTPILIPLPSPTIIIFEPITPTAFPFPTSIPIGSDGGLPPTGTSPNLLIIGGVITAVAGAILFLLTRTLL
ncbi:MAG: Ig-like domain-containing protein [Candidatus Parcubacteria bacterium]|nr:Ig-like domain-containing protein [Candidatus Parcubacteria bacterium]